MSAKKAKKRTTPKRIEGPLKSHAKLFGERFSSLRKNYNLTQNIMAERIGVPQSKISNYESGKRIPSHLVSIKIAREFSVSVDWLLGLTLFNTGNSNKELEELSRLLAGLAPESKANILSYARYISVDEKGLILSLKKD